MYWLARPHTISIFDTFAVSPYETGLAWVTTHTPLALLALVMLAVVTQNYCCRRYIDTEITS
jgi:hypothetical protein